MAGPVKKAVAAANKTAAAQPPAGRPTNPIGGPRRLSEPPCRQRGYNVDHHNIPPNYTNQFGNHYYASDPHRRYGHIRAHPGYLWQQKIGPPPKNAYKPPAPVVNTLHNRYNAQDFANKDWKHFSDRIRSNNDHSLPLNKRDPVVYAQGERGERRQYTALLMPPTDKRWGGHGMPQAGTDNLYYEPVLSDDILDKHKTFEEWKNQRTYDDYYPGLFKNYRKVYPGRLFSTEFGSFNWWGSEPNLHKPSSSNVFLGMRH